MSPIALSPASSSPHSALTESLVELQTAIDGYEANPTAANRRALRDARRSTVGRFAALQKITPHSAIVRAYLDTVQRVLVNGGLDEPLTDTDRSELAASEGQGWQGVVAAMLLTPAWRWQQAPLLSRVPDWLWEDYAEWLFAVPNPFLTSADANAYASHLNRHVDELARWTDRNIGSASVRAAADVYARRSSLLAVRIPGLAVRALAENRGRILTRLFARNNLPFEPMLQSRVGRRLRVGFIARDWEASAETFAALARFEHLPTDRFEVVLFSTREVDSGFAGYCRTRAADVRVLPEKTADAVTTLQDNQLDVAVFATDMEVASDDFGRLALHRVAALQVALRDDRFTTGLPEIDLLPVAKAAGAEAEQFSERVGLLSGPLFGYALHRGSEAGLAYSRADLGFGPDAFIFVVVLPANLGVLDQVDVWTKLLAHVPRARLVVHILPGSGAQAAYAVERFTDVLRDSLARHGVAEDAVSILAPDLVTIAETRAIVRLGHALLAQPGTMAWTAEALSAGIPVLSADPLTTELLAEERLDSLAATRDEEMLAMAVALATDEARSSALQAQLAGVVESGFAFLDSKATSDAFGALLEAAFDSLEVGGHAAFRREKAPVSSTMVDNVESVLQQADSALERGDVAAAASAARLALDTDPRHVGVRAVQGRVLLAQGQGDAAAEYLLAAVQQRVDDPELWITLAKAFHQAGKHNNAVQALESALRLDPRRVEAWQLLRRLARDAGHAELGAQADEILRELGASFSDEARSQFENLDLSSLFGR